jgi:hypothetical protein
MNCGRDLEKHPDCDHAESGLVCQSCDDRRITYRFACGAEHRNVQPMPKHEAHYDKRGRVHIVVHDSENDDGSCSMAPVFEMASGNYKNRNCRFLCPAEVKDSGRKEIKCISEKRPDSIIPRIIVTCCGEEVQ